MFDNDSGQMRMGQAILGGAFVGVLVGTIACYLLRPGSDADQEITRALADLSKAVRKLRDSAFVRVSARTREEVGPDNI
jgi:gas vesicle protein